MEKEVYKSLIKFDTDKPSALCSILQWKGSVPRKDYPNMLVTVDQSIIGTVGGGRMEFEVIEKAKEIIENQTPALLSFDLTSDLVEGDSGICGGTTQILIEPYTREVQHFFQSMNLLNGSSGYIITGFDSKNKNITRGWKHHLSDIKTTSPFLSLIDSNLITQTVEHNDHVYLIEKMLPIPALHIFGAGHVGKSVADLAKFIDLNTHVYDDRNSFLSKNRFPQSIITKVNYSSEFESQVAVEPHDYVLVATRGHKHDLEIMRWLLEQNVQYLSLISSHRKWNLLRQSLSNEGFSDKKLSTVHSPVGLDIDAQTVSEIAVSIISEIIHYYRKQKRSSLSLSVKGK